MRKLIDFLISIGIVVALGFTGYFGWDYYQNLKQKETATKESAEVKDLAVEEITINSKIKQKVNLSKLQQTINPDIVSWLYVPETNINEAVLQNKQDTNFYLRRDIRKNYNIYGVLFFDKDSDPATDYVSYMFGHNTDDDTKFSQLEKFWDANYKNKNWYVYKDGYQYEYELVTRFEVSPRSSIYPVEEFAKEDSELLKKALLDYKIPKDVVDSINSTDQYMFLVTCENWDNSSARRVVFGKLVSKVKYE